MGVTKSISPVPLLSDVFSNFKTHVSYLISRSYLAMSLQLSCGDTCRICDTNNGTGTIEGSKILSKEILTNRALVTPTPALLRRVTNPNWTSPFKMNHQHYKRYFVWSRCLANCMVKYFTGCTLYIIDIKCNMICIYHIYADETVGLAYSSFTKYNGDTALQHWINSSSFIDNTSIVDIMLCVLN